MHKVNLTSGAYEWIDAKGDIPQSRVGHVAGVINDTIYVFGGVSYLLLHKSRPKC